MTITTTTTYDNTNQIYKVMTTMFTSTDPMHITNQPLEFNWDYGPGSQRIAKSSMNIDRMNGSRLREREIFNGQSCRPHEIYPNWPENWMHEWLDKNVSDLHVDMEFTYQIDIDSIVCELQIRGTVPDHLMSEYQQSLIMFKIGE